MMKIFPSDDLYRLPICWLRSTLCLITVALSLFFATNANAHETRPAIVDVTVGTAELTLDWQVTLESLVAGLDLSELADTDESPLAKKYDALRALDAAALEIELRNAWPQIGKSIQLYSGETRLEPVLMSVEIAPVGDVTIPRDSTIHLSALLTSDDTAITLGWDATNGPLVVRQVLTEGDGYSGYLTGGEASAPIPRSGSAQVPWLTEFVDYISIGFEHIVPKGLDHILFVLGLFFFSLHLRPLLFQVTAFTLAHTVTLALAILGVVQVPANIVEPLIALSIVYVAVDNIFMQELRPWRTVVVFGFGLLHGLGFASVLGDIGLDSARFITGLIGFNIGVELGQLTVIVAAFLLVGLWFGKKEWYRQFVSVPASVAIAIVGAYWFVERTFLA